MNMEIRRLQEEDIADLARIEGEAFSMPWSEKDFRELLSHSYCFYLTALADGRAVGCCGYTASCGTAYIDNVVVAAGYRRQGIGQALMAELIVRGREERIEAFTLEVRVSNVPAIHLYKKLGFVSEGIRPGFYEKPVEDADIMWLRLNGQEGTESDGS